MAVDFYKLSRSLKEYLIDAQSDSYNSRNVSKWTFYKYNNLRLYMDKKKTTIPHFIVRVGISEAMFTIHGCMKIHGGLGADERYIYRWHEKSNVEAELHLKWKEHQKFEPVTMKGEVD